MNDNQEILHALALCQAVCGSKAKETSGRELEFLNRLYGELHFQKTNQTHIFTVSFSESRDQLSQWRAYTRNGGYALSFKGSALSHVAKSQGYLIAKCIYEEEQKIKLLNEFVSHKVSESATEKNIDLLAACVANDFLVMAAMMKHQGFSEEREWRLISTTSRDDPSHIKYRSVARYLIPYLEVSVSPDVMPQIDGRRKFIGIDEVLVGPAPEPELSWRSCMQLLIDRDIHFDQITPSGTPYRAS
ncbi:MAG: DUF2971 domain-containing protein [Rhodocyclaceae bacterium]|nr:DUF2971 domain-containing protein [Rhodocyclaceae bacterium]MDZ4214423.1 DUF2971 domain-containing protein [Rhodocyclaceae bacterium]